MNKNKLKEYVNALDALSDDIKDWDVAMMSTNEPSCGTPGCHAGLISIVAKDLPELEETHLKVFKIYFKVYKEIKPDLYVYSIWADALAEFLGFSEEKDLKCWAKDNPKLWGNIFGGNMFMDAVAFTDDTDDKSKKLTHRDIINHWKQVLVNIENEGVEI
jgi:hypothetical protein